MSVETNTLSHLKSKTAASSPIPKSVESFIISNVLVISSINLNSPSSEMEVKSLFFFSFSNLFFLQI